MKYIALFAAIFAASQASAAPRCTINDAPGAHCWGSKFDGRTAAVFAFDPIPVATDEGLGAGSGD